MNTNPFNNAPSEASLFTVEQLQEIQRQMVIHAHQMQGGGGGGGGQSQSHSEEQHFQHSPALGNAPNAQANSSNAPFLIMTQLPVQATPFATNPKSGNGGMGEGFNQNPQASQGQAQAQQQQNQSNPFGMGNTSFANIMEPMQFQPQSQPTDNTNTNAAQNANSFNNNNNNNNSNLNNASATGNTYLEQLMRNAYAAQPQGEQHTQQQQQRLQQLQQQQQQQQQQQNQQSWQLQSNPNSFSSQGGQQQGQGHTMDTSSDLGGVGSGNMSMGITKQQQALYTLGSTVEPVSMKETQESRQALDLAGWKHFWDDDEDDNDEGTGRDKIMPLASVAPLSKAKSKQQERDQPQQLQQQQQQQQQHYVRSTNTDATGSDKIMPPAPVAPPSKAKRKQQERDQPQQLQQQQQQQLQQLYQQPMVPPSYPSPLLVKSAPTSMHHPRNQFSQDPVPSMDCSISNRHDELNISNNDSQFSHGNQIHNSSESIYNSSNTNTDNHNSIHGDDDDGDDFSPTPLHKIHSRHSQYQQRRKQEQQRVQQTIYDASPALSSRSAPASIPYLQQQEASNQDPLSVSQRMLHFQMQQQQYAAQQQEQSQQQVDQQVQQMKHQQLQAQQGKLHNPPLHQRQQIQHLQQQQQKAQKRQRQPKSQQIKSRSDLASRAPAPSASSKNQAFLLPTTMMPPSVLASVLTAQKVAHDSGGKAPAPSTGHPKKSGNKCMRVESPQDVLQRLLSMRGFGSSTRIKAAEANYDTMPSPLQLASFGTELVKAIHSSDVETLDKLLSCGLSPNPCNQFRDSIVDLVCKRANHKIFQCLIDNGCDLRVCDGFGRTPLHHSCWACEFSPEIAELILSRDWLQLLIEDKRGQTPLEYVRPDTAGDWIDFLESHKESLFPIGGCVPTLDSLKELRPDGALPDPPNALPVKLAAAVSSGDMTPEEALDFKSGHEGPS